MRGYGQPIAVSVGKRLSERSNGAGGQLLAFPAGFDAVCRPRRQKSSRNSSACSKP